MALQGTTVGLEHPDDKRAKLVYAHFGEDAGNDFAWW